MFIFQLIKFTIRYVLAAHRYGDRCVLENFYNMKNQFWTVCSGLGWTVKKKGWADYEQLLRPVFLSFHGQKINLKFFFENIVGSALQYS